MKKIIFALKDPKVAGVYGRQKPLSYSSDFDKRDLINLFGPEKKIQKKDTFFHNANSAFRKKLWSKIPFDEMTKHIEDRIWGNEVINKAKRMKLRVLWFFFFFLVTSNNSKTTKCQKI